MDVCVPVLDFVDDGNVRSMILERCEAMTIIHTGPYENIRDAYREVTKEAYSHGLPIAESGRKVLLNLDLDNPEENFIEIQEILHDWEARFSKNLESQLGTETSRQVLKCYGKISYESSLEERVKAVKCAIDTLDEIATEDQKSNILSSCAHVFPPELIERMRQVYVTTKDVDAVLDAMEVTENYPEFTREGNLLYSSKKPSNPDAFANAKNRKERFQAYCYCPMIKHSLDEIGGAFCYCGSGWVRRLWEGILERPLKVEIVKSLTKGHDECNFAVHLPI